MLKVYKAYVCIIEILSCIFTGKVYLDREEESEQPCGFWGIVMFGTFAGIYIYLWLGRTLKAVIEDIEEEGVLRIV